VQQLRNLIAINAMFYYICFHINKPTMKRIKEFFFSIIVSITILSLSGCTDPTKVAEVALTTTEEDKGETAVWKLTDQSLLTKVASEAFLSQVREAAVRKLTDQSTLTKIALDNAEYDFICEAAVKNLTDPAMLVKVALEDKRRDLRRAAVRKLIDPAMLARLAKLNDDKRIQLFNKLILDFDNVPNKHWERLIIDILPAIAALDDIAVVNIVGEIVSVKVDWLRTSEVYMGAGQRIMEGEKIKFSIIFKNLSRPISCSWSSKFKPKVFTTLTTHTIGFSHAVINVDELLEPVFEPLSQSGLIQVALEGSNSLARKTAIKKLTDQSILAKIAVDSAEHWRDRVPAIKKLTDQSILAKIAVDSTIHERGAVRTSARDRLDALRNPGRK